MVAHRGASAWAPENTLAAVRLAHAEGATAVECDVHCTLDGVLVVHHDATLGRCTDAARTLRGRAPWRIADLTFAEVRRVDAASWFGHGFEGEPVPTLEEWIGAVGPRLGMFIEVKASAAASTTVIEQELDPLVRNLPAARAVHAEHRLTVQSFDHDWLSRFKQVAPDVPVGLLTTTRLSRRELVEAARWAEQVNPMGRVVTEPMVARAHDCGLRVNAWTVDNPARMRQLVGWGVDGIITNVPARLVSLLESRGT